jgi:predicted amidohydrolase
MKIVLSQINPLLSKINLEKHKKILHELDSDVKLVIFPELSLNGYYLQDKVLEDAWTLKELIDIQNCSVKFDIVVGGVIKERRRFYNSALYFSKGKLLNLYHKRDLPNYGLFEEPRFFNHGEKFTYFETDFGRVVTLICEDVWSGQIFGELSNIEPDVIIVISNSPARGFNDNGIEIIEQWKALLKSLSILNNSYTIFVNRVGFEDGLGFWGGSMAINPKGEILDSFPLFKEKIDFINLPINIDNIGTSK